MFMWSKLDLKYKNKKNTKVCPKEQCVQLNDNTDFVYIKNIKCLRSGSMFYIILHKKHTRDKDTV